jgi:release factor glutamine methyltransferase
VVVALAKELPQVHWAGVDISAGALAVARENARHHGVAERVHFLQGDLLAAFKPQAWFDVLVANLPYVPRRMWETLARDIRDFEPRAAFRGGEDGLDLIRPLIRQAHLYVKAGGWVLLEVGDGQAAKVEGLFEETGAYDCAESLKDFSGIERVVRARRRAARD